MRTYLLITCLALSMRGGALLAADDPAPATQPSGGESLIIDASDKAAIDAAMGKEVVVEGVVESTAWSSSGKVLFIKFDKNKETRFSVVVFEKHKTDFDSAFSGDITKALPGAKVRIRGTIKDYRSQPEIIADVPAQITILEPPPTSQPTTGKSG